MPDAQTPRPIALNDVPRLVGEEIGLSGWLLIDQARIDAFAAVTNDRQWIHIDVERATAELGGTVAHGFLTLSMMSSLTHEIFKLEGASKRLNYGFERLRFTAPVFARQRIRLRMTLAEATPKGEGLAMAFDCVMEVEGAEKPALVARWISVAYP